MTLRGSMPDSLPALLDELADELKTHFEHEEVGGYFLGVVDRAPRLIGHVESLKHQHGELRSAARELAELAHRQKTNADDWPRLRTDCEDFVDQLLTHEAAENDLLQEAYTQDIGEED